MSTSSEVIVHEFHATNIYRYYVLGVLIIVGALAWIDRQLLSIVLQSIKVEFSLTDTQLGLIGGVAFGLFYVTVGLPIAWLADRYSRTKIISRSIALWSVLSTACGIVTGFWGLFFARMGVGIGEAGAAPPSQSILSDYFSPEQRGLAMGLLYSYIPIGYFVSYGLGGLLNDKIGWRMAFVVFGVPGILIAMLVRLTVREPPRGNSERAHLRQKDSEPRQLVSSLKQVLRRRTLRLLPIAGAAHAIGMVGASVWMPAYFIRTYHMSSTVIGWRLAAVLGFGGLVGVLVGGHLADRVANRTGDPRWHIWMCAIAALSAVPFTVAMYVTKDANLALLLFIVPSVLNHSILGPVFATVQTVGGVRYRATAAAWYLFVVNLISMGLGPTLIGTVSDLAHARFGDDSLRYSLMGLVSLSSTTAGICFLLSAKALSRDLTEERKQTEHGAVQILQRSS